MIVSGSKGRRGETERRLGGDEHGDPHSPYVSSWLRCLRSQLLDRPMFGAVAAGSEESEEQDPPRWSTTSWRVN